MGASVDPSVDVIVVNYRTPDDLVGFLQSFEVHAPTIPWELWIVNVDPTGEDISVAQRWSERLDSGGRVHVVNYDWNCGYAHACNAAALDGAGSTIVLFNADVVLAAGAIDECCAALHQHDEWAILGPKQVDDLHRITHAGIFGTVAQPKHRGWREPDSGQYSDVLESAISVSGSAYFVKREVWNRLAACPRYREAVPNAPGAFLPTPLFYEETWASVHALSHGHRVVYYGPVCIIHRWHQAVKKNGLELESVAAMKEAHEMYRRACDTHGIPHD